MSSSAVEAEAPDLVCELDNVQGIVDALTSVRWKRHQVSITLFRLLSHIFIFCLILSDCNEFNFFFLEFTQPGRRRRIIGTRHSDNRRGNQLSSGQSLFTT